MFLVQLQATCIETIVGASLLHQFFMIATLNNTSMVHNHNDIGIHNG